MRRSFLLNIVNIVWQTMRKRRALGIAALLILMLVAVGLNLPYRGWVEAKLKRDLAAAGLGAVDFTVSDVNFQGIVLSDVALDGQRLESVALGYTPLEILQGNFRSLKAHDIALRQGNVRVGLNEVVLDIAPDEEQKKWTGTWAVGAITLSGVPVEIPSLSAKGTLTREGGNIGFEGDVASADKQFRGAFSFGYDGVDTSRTVFLLKSLGLPWNGGRVSMEKVSVPLYSDAPIRFLLHLKKVSLSTLMAGATGNKATATGSISGAVPVTVRRNGEFSLHAGKFKADGGGTLTLSPELLPGDNPQMQMMRDVLKDFQYVVFDMALQNADSKQLSMLLSLRGHNPEVYNGRQINLNVHLTGDVIELLTQSVMMYQNPQQLLEQKPHE